MVDVELPADLLFACDVERATRSQGAIGGTKMNFSQPAVILQGVEFAIQSMKPTEIELWRQRDISVDHKCYTTHALTGVELGDRIKDTRYIPPRYYIVVWVEDMAGVGVLRGVFCKLL